MDARFIREVYFQEVIINRNINICDTSTYAGNLEFVNFGPCLRDVIQISIPNYINNRSSNLINIKEFQDAWGVYCVAISRYAHRCERILDVQFISNRPEKKVTFFVEYGPRIPVLLTLEVAQVNSRLVVASASVEPVTLEGN